MYEEDFGECRVCGGGFWSVQGTREGSWEMHVIWWGILEGAESLVVQILRLLLWPLTSVLGVTINANDINEGAYFTSTLKALTL